jgi:hypothetical protein
MIAHMAAAALLVMQTTAEETPCLTRAEVSDLAMTLAPTLVHAVGERCRGHVAGTAFLNAGLDAYRSRLEPAASAHRPAGLRAFAKLAGGEQLVPEQQAAALSLMTASLEAGINGSLPIEACGDVDHILEALAPLPPENLGILASSIFALALRNSARSPRPDGAGHGRAGSAVPAVRICQP